MVSDPDKLLNRLVVAALTVFVTVVILLAALVFRQVWLQQRLADVSSTLETNLVDLEDTTEQIQSELAQIDSTTSSTQTKETVGEINELLEDVDQQLESIDEGIDEVAVALEPEAAPTSSGDSQPPTFTQDELAQDAVTQDEGVQDDVDEVFAIFAALVGIAGLAIAVLLGMALRVQKDLPDKDIAAPRGPR